MGLGDAEQNFANAASNLLVGKGRALGAGQRATGEIWGSTLATLGDRIPKQVQEVLRQRAEQQRQAQIQSIFQQAGGDLDKAIPQLRALDPELALSFEKELNEAEAVRQKAADLKAKHDAEMREFRFGALASAQNESQWASSILGLQKAGYDVSDLPTSYSPEAVKQINLMLASPDARLKATEPDAEKLMNVAPGGAIFDPKSREKVFENPYQMTPDQSADNERANAQLDLSRAQADETKRHNQATERRLAQQAASGGTGAPTNDAAFVDAVMTNPDLFTNLTPTVRTRIAPLLAQRGFKNFGPAPSAMERMDARKFEKAEPVIASINELSERINTQQGLVAKISGAVERANAQMNLNDDVAEYQALVSGFTPLVARALGHTGVLTQQDVDSVKALFPKPGDSKSLRDRKVARLKNIVGQLEQLQGGAPSGTDTAAPSARPAAPAGLSYQDYLKSRQK